MCRERERRKRTHDEGERDDADGLEQAALEERPPLLRVALELLGDARSSNADADDDEDHAAGRAERQDDLDGQDEESRERGGRT